MKWGLSALPCRSGIFRSASLANAEAAASSRMGRDHANCLRIFINAAFSCVAITCFGYWSTCYRKNFHDVQPLVFDGEDRKIPGYDPLRLAPARPRAAARALNED